MNILSELYRPSLGLLTDLYQLTMAYGYWQQGMADRESVFHLFFRKNPFKGAYAVAAGLEYAVAFMENLRFDVEDLNYLGSLKGNDGKALFDQGFIDYLAGFRFRCNVDAMPEGTLAFPHEPLLRIQGPLLQCQLVETPLLTIMNFQTLIATKAARVCEVAAGDTVMEFGLRRAQGIDGGLAASRAAYIGGCDSTSNVLAGRLFGIPVKGTHAHSWVMSFESELESFEAYAAALPNNCVFLVDTYDTEEGVRHAVEVGKKLRARGHEMLGVRLDSGDLATLSIAARHILDDGGFPNARIIASNDLDEYTMQELKQKGAQITIWGVGTKLATAYDQPALGGVYKLGAIRDEDGNWDYKIKLSEDLIKISNPGLIQVRRFYREGRPVADLLYNAEQGVEGDILMDPLQAGLQQPLPEYDSFADILLPIFRDGELVYHLPNATEIRARTLRQVQGLPKESRRLQNPEPYPTGLETQLFRLKMDLIGQFQAQ